MALRQLTPDEISVLESRRCHAEDWSKIRVAEDFTTGNSFHDVEFSGDIVLGSFHGTLVFDGNTFTAGVDNSRLHNVSVGDNSLVAHSNVSNTDIGDNAVVQDVGTLTRLGHKPFAHNSPVHVLAEDGVRSVPLSRHMTAQLGHIICHFKKHPAARAIEDMLENDSLPLKRVRSFLGSGAHVRHVAHLRNVWIGEGARIDGAASLKDCYIDSSRSAPTHIGEGVAAEDCVFLTGCRVTGGTRLKHCLAGEGVILDGGFSGKHSLFFANSEFALGEAACAMAGPYAVSHHKATLVLTCQCSFNTFGSAANSSNHHFKLGPLHGGVLRRGVRCGSGSYIFWPADIGAFSTVVGKHSTHLETAGFPFSLVLEKGGATVLIPGVNLFTSGAFRDAVKWRDRDRRSNLERPRDLVNPAILSPYVLQAMEAGMELLDRSVDMGVDLRHGGAVIPASRFEPALRRYRTALVFHTGERILARAMQQRGGGCPSPEEVAAIIRSATAEGEGLSSGRWRDWGGMLLPGAEADRVIAELSDGTIAEPEALRRRLEEIHGRYDDYELAWLAWRWRRQHGDPTRETVAAFFMRWRKAVHFRHECLVKDANKEFTPEVMFGFGVEEEASESFRRVRGALEEHPLLALAEAERERLLAMAEFIPVPEKI